MVDGVDRTSLLFQDWRIDDNDKAIIDTINIELDDQSADVDVPIGKDLILEDAADATKRLFAGIIAEAIARPSGVGRIWNITAQDWKLILDRSTVAKEFRNQSDLETIQEAFTDAEVTEIDTTAEDGRAEIIRATIPFIRFNGETLRQVLDTISQITGADWNIDKFKKLIYRLPKRIVSSFTFSDAPDNINSFPYRGAKRISELGSYNLVEIRGVIKLSDDTTDTFSGDGTETVFFADTKPGHSISRPPIACPATNPSCVLTIIVIEENTGTDGSPVWTLRTVGLLDRDTLGVGGIEVIWNPATAFIEFNTAPPNFTNSWRITGRFESQLSVTVPEEGIPTGQRIYKKIIVEPTLDEEDLAVDIGLAFLRESKDKDRIQIAFDKDGLNINEAVGFANTILGVPASLPPFSDSEYIVHSLTTKLRGAEVFEYSAVLGAGSHSLAHLLSELKFKAGSIPVPIFEATTFVKLVSDKVRIVNIKSRTAIRGPNYFCEDSATRRNFVKNPNFEVDLTGWTEVIEAGITATTSRVTAQKKFGFNSLKLDITASTATGRAYRHFDVTVVATEIWSLLAHVFFQSGTNSQASIAIDWLDNVDAILSTERQTLVVNTAFAEIKLENKTAPVNAVKARIRLELEVTTIGGTGTVFHDGIIFEKETSIADYFDGFQGDGFWQDTADNSESVKGANEIIAGFWKAG